MKKIFLQFVLLLSIFPIVLSAQYGTNFTPSPYPPSGTSIIDPHFTLQQSGHPAYWIGDNMNNMAGFPDCPGNGDFLIIDDDQNGQGAIIYQENLSGVTGSIVHFEFSALHRFTSAQSNSTLVFWLEINGVQEETFQLTTRMGCNWTHFETCIHLPSNTQINSFTLRQQGGSVSYDYGLDDIIFDVCDEPNMEFNYEIRDCEELCFAVTDDHCADPLWTQLHVEISNPTNGQILHSLFIGLNEEECILVQPGEEFILKFTERLMNVCDSLIIEHHDPFNIQIPNPQLQNEFIIVDNEGSQKDPFCSPERLFLEEINIIDEIRYKIDVRKTQFCPFEPFLDPIIDWRTTGWVNGQVSSPLELTNLWSPSPFTPGAFEIRLTVEDACGNRLEYIQYFCITECFVEIVDIIATRDPNDPCVYCYEPIINVSDCVDEIRYSWFVNGEWYSSEQNPCITFCSGDLADVQLSVEVWSEDPQISLPCDFASHIDTITPVGCDGCKIINNAFLIGTDVNCDTIHLDILSAETNSCTEVIAYEIYWTEDEVQLVEQLYDPVSQTYYWNYSYKHAYIPKEGREICLIAIGVTSQGDTCKSEVCWDDCLPCDDICDCLGCEVINNGFQIDSIWDCGVNLEISPAYTNECTELVNYKVEWRQDDFIVKDRITPDANGNWNLNISHDYNIGGAKEICVIAAGVVGVDTTCFDTICQSVFLLCDSMPCSCDFEIVFSGVQLDLDGGYYFTTSPNVANCFYVEWLTDCGTVVPLPAQGGAIVYPEPGCLEINICAKGTICENWNCTSVPLGPPVVEKEHSWLAENLMNSRSNDQAKSLDSRFSITPNPADHQVTISLNDHKSSIERLTIYNTNGQRIEQFHQLGSHQTQLDISSYIEGLYMIEIIDQNGKQSIEKLIVK